MLSSIFGKKKPSYVGEDGFFSFTKGFALNLEGDVADGSIHEVGVTRYAVKPANYRPMSPIPKVQVSVGDNVKAGDVLFFDKKRPEIMYTAPVSGEVIDVVRGAKRAITDVVILADKTVSYRTFDVPSLSDRKAVVDLLLTSGAWTLINKRPFDVVPDIASLPRDIFVSTFSTAPLAVDYSVVINGKEAYFQKGLDVLNGLTEGSVYLGLDGNGSKPSVAFSEAKGVKRNYFAGKHPAGNVGVQMHHVAPINPGDEVWTLDVQAVITLGRLFSEGVYDVSRVVKLAGDELAKPQYVSTFAGANVGELLKGNLKEGNNRLISGDVLSGAQIDGDGYLNAGDDLITVVAEGDDYELLGWLAPMKSRPSISPTFLSSLIPSVKYQANTNTRGERRAFVATGQYEKVLPMSIYPQHLMKAILANDFESMEGLGINELSEEDIAICEFVCTSKQPLQSILRKGLDIIREQS